MLVRLLLLFILVPLAELILLLYLADVTHWWVAVLLVLATGLAGTLLARSQGVKTYRRIHAAMSQGKVPTDALIDAAMIFVAGALLLTPGILTDAVGLSLLVPPCRRWYRRRLVQWFRSRFIFVVESAEGSEAGGSGAEVIDSHVVPRSQRKIESGSDKPG